MKVALIHNLQAGDQDQTRKQLLEFLRRHNYEPIALTLGQLSRQKPANVPGEFVIVAGGDGSVKRAASFFAGSGRPLAILPMGTANNIAHSLDIAGSAEKIIAGWATASNVPIDLGVAQGPWGRRYFIESIGIGLIVRAIAVMDRIGLISPRDLANREDRLYRDLCVLLALTHELRPLSLRLGLDGRQPHAGRFLLCEVLNIRRSGPGVELSRSANPSDGFLDLVSVEAHERHKLLRLLERCLAGRAQTPLLHTRRVRRVQLTLGSHELRLDDEIVWPPKNRSALRSKPRQITVSVEIARGVLQCLLPRKRD